MDRETQVALARRLMALRAAGTIELAGEVYRNPVADYTSRAQLAREREHLFRRHPILVALGCDVAAPGDFVTLDVAGAPVLLVRDDDGRLRAFLNVCRHRGSPVARGRGRAPRRFVCPYHGWTYDLAGRLIARRHAEAFEGADGEGCSLAALPVAEAFGLVYVRPTPGEPVDVARLLGGLERELGPYGFEHWHHVETRVLERAMNWKLVVDTFLEAYHVPALHGESLAPKMHGSLAVADRFGRNGRMLAARRSLEQLDGRPESEWTVVPHATIIYCLFPNTVLIGQQDHVELWQVFPHDDSPDHAAMVITLYAPEAVTSEKAARHWQANMDLLVRVTNEEDFVLCEQAQRGFHTGAQASIVFGRNEMLLAHYHRAIREAISEEA